MNNTTKNPAAVALGKLNRGIKKTITPERSEELRGYAAAARAALALKRATPTPETPVPERACPCGSPGQLWGSAETGWHFLCMACWIEKRETMKGQQ